MSQTQQINFVEIEELYREYGQPAYTLAFRMLGNSERAEAAVQAVFLDYWRSPEPFEREEFLNWLLQAVRRKCLGRRGKSFTVKPANYSPQKIKLALTALPADQQELLELAYFSGQDHRQLAEQMRQPASRVKKSLIQSLIQLRKGVYTG